ncbi:MAG: hypothetical protein HC929_21265 [Leptolyngbyaceae cyanobacterium SM2_5_2]|nr:hypothetical protein [Leptolyngbyaceae cyanobacterium SM2_5_2]
MFQSSSEFNSEANPGQTPSPAPFALSTYRQETLRHILLGDYDPMVAAINHLVALGYCERIAWTEPHPTGRSGEYISLMTHRRGRAAL